MRKIQEVFFNDPKIVKGDISRVEATLYKKEVVSIKYCVYTKELTVSYQIDQQCDYVIRDLELYKREQSFVIDYKLTAKQGNGITTPITENDFYKKLPSRATWTLGEVLLAFNEYDPIHVLKEFLKYGKRPWTQLLVLPNHPIKRKK
jgi:hypothetical protein